MSAPQGQPQGQAPNPQPAAQPGGNPGGGGGAGDLHSVLIQYCSAYFLSDLVVAEVFKMKFSVYREISNGQEHCLSTIIRGATFAAEAMPMEILVSSLVIAIENDEVVMNGS
eukprot:scaffold1988_cov121-Cylindrotheca_fusiformis.AAC.4